MGWRIDVEAWVNMNHEQRGFTWVKVYEGNSWIKALWEMRQARRESGAVRLTWR